ncbi:DUF3800 domain-containing protein [Sphingomonas sp. LHG3406-1]|uniref:DUF3800 domain-containing protein n=1 Tax=Sphingomonas sp. LHG3406-1 TaxID=2804617 RepID=UPI002637A3C7|nr:DUF3800 domain-containing protein [Sphingomonas sp. LHG3406-1]
MFVPPSARYRLYIDETGTQTLKAGHSDRFLCLAGVIMRQDIHDGPFTASLNAIKRTFFEEGAEVILHRREMVRGEAPFQQLLHDEQVRRLFEDAWLEFVAKSNYLIIAGAIDKVAHREKYKVWQHDPYHYCLEILVERFVKWLSRNGFQGDVLIESRDKWADKRLKKAYSHLYQHGNLTVRASKVQSVLLSREIKFARKTDNVAGHQLADSLAHPLLRYLKTEKTGMAPATGFGPRLVEELFRRRLARDPRTGKIDGWGLKWLPE